MIRLSMIVFTLLISCPFLAAEAAVDKITLKDGSILKGEIKRVENDELTLDTDYADDVIIEVEHIVAIESEQIYTVRMTEGEEISGHLTVTDGKIVLREELPRESESGEALPETPSSISPVVADGRVFTFDDVDWIDEKESYLRYDAEVNVGAQLARGNTDTTDLHFDALFEPSFGQNTLRLRGEFDRKEADGDTTADRWLASLEYERDFRRRWFVGAANSYEADGQRDLDLRMIVGAGVGYRFFDEDPTHLSAMPSIAYVIETFEDSDDDDNYVAFRWKLDFSRDLYKDDITIYHNHQYLNSLQTFSDILIETRTGIEFDLAWDLTLSTEFQANWDNAPASDTDELDTRYILKIGFEFEGDQGDWFH
jgi:hypothetical protein